METFNFKGDWKPVLRLKEFQRLTNPDLILDRYISAQSKGDFEIEIIDCRDNNPDPLPEQINAIEFLLNNQRMILHALINYFKGDVYPKYKAFMSPEEYPDAFPELNGVDDLYHLIAVRNIFIKEESKDGHAYIVFNFKTYLDYEHGLCITLHKDRCIESSDLGNLSNEKIEADGGKKAAIPYGLDGGQTSYEGVYSPDKKYGKLKPWQLDSAESTFRNLLESSESEKVIELIELANWDVNAKFPSRGLDLINLACEQLDKKVAQVLVAKGAQIDSLNQWNETGLFTNLMHFANAKWTSGSFLDKNIEKFAMYEKKAASYLPKIKLFLELGANPQVCNSEGLDYKQLLERKWTVEFLRRSGIYREIDSLLDAYSNQKS